MSVGSLGCGRASIAIQLEGGLVGAQRGIIANLRDAPRQTWATLNSRFCSTARSLSVHFMVGAGVNLSWRPLQSTRWICANGGPFIFLGFAPALNPNLNPNPNLSYFGIFRLIKHRLPCRIGDVSHAHETPDDTGLAGF